MQKEAIEGYRLSPQQERYWLLQRYDQSKAYCAQCIIMIEGDLNVDALMLALQNLIAKHEILRTSFQQLPGMTLPLQVIIDGCKVVLPSLDLSLLSAERQHAEVDALFEKTKQSDFEFEDDSLMRMWLITLSPAAHMLLMCMPALCADSTSLATMASQVAESYTAALAGEEYSPGLMQYADFSEWQNQLLESAEAEAAREYWHKQDISSWLALSLPFENEASDQTVFQPEAMSAIIGPAAAQSIKSLAAKYDASCASFLHTCWQALMWRLTGQTRIVTGRAFDYRVDEELERTVGLLTKYLPVSCELDDDLPFNHLLMQVARTEQDAGKWQECFSWGRIVESDSSDRQQPFLPVCFDFSDNPTAHSACGVSFSLYKRYACIDRFKLKLSCQSNGDCIVTDVHYDPKCFSPGSIERLIQQLYKLIESAIAGPEAGIGSLEMVTSSELEQLLLTLNDTKAEYEIEKPVHKLFEEQVRQTPNNYAVAFKDERLTYSELNARANRLAHRLRELGVGPEVLVALFMERSVNMVVGILATLKAGGAYLPLDLNHPAERLAFMLQDAKPLVLLTQKRAAAPLPASDARVVYMDCGWEKIAKYGEGNPEGRAKPCNLAYIIYTSGSTGKPKGAMITHLGLSNYLNWCTKYYEVDKGKGSLVHSPLGFDLTVTSLFPALLAGRETVLLLEDDGVEGLVSALRKESNLSLVKITPAHLEILNQSLSPGQAAGRTRAFIIGGEALYGESLSFWRAHAPETRLINEYGPTETVVGCCVYETVATDRQSGPVPIGRPIANTQLYLLNSRLRPVSYGLQGELYIGGDGLARGYFNRPDLTADRFIPNPFGEAPGARLYKTGDLARYLPDGNIEFIGRVDDQVKIRGNRIEPGEVEAVAKQHPAIRDAAVTLREYGPGDKRLVAYLVPDSEHAFTVRQLLDLKELGMIDNRMPYELPNGMVIFQKSKGETDYLYTKIFEQQTYLKHGITFRDGDCIFDVGANIGLFTLFAGQKCKNTIIYSFEPIPEVFEVLRLNTSLYESGVKLYECGISSQPSVEKSGYYPHVRISDVISENEVDRIDLLKIDAEKSELDVLAGIDESDWGKINQIVIEVHDIEDRVSLVTAMLNRQGFDFAIEQEAYLEHSNLFVIYGVRPSIDRGRRAGNGVCVEVAKTSAWTSPERLIADVRSFLNEKLPEYMTPSAIVLLNALPVTRNGKMDRKALPAPELTAPGSHLSQDQPRTPLEEVLAGIFAQLLGVEQVGIHDNFFEMGGHSLLATQLISRVRQVFQTEVSLRLIFESPTVAGLGQSISNAIKSGRRPEAPPIVATTRGSRLPLSFAQQRLWFLDQLMPNNPFYNVPAAIRMTGKLDIAALGRTLSRVVSRHEVLRTSFSVEEGEPVQVIGKAEEVRLPVIDVSGLGKQQREAEARRVAGEEARTPFHLCKGPMLRATVVRLADEEHIVMMSMHHIVSDGWSVGVLVKEVGELYEGYVKGEEVEMEELEIQYGDYAVWQRGWMKGEVLEEEVRYWRKQLGGEIGVMEMGRRGTRKEAQGSRGGREVRVVSREVRDKVKEMSRREGVTMFMWLLAAFKVMLHKYTGLDDIVVGTDIANRNRSETENLIGFFVNQLVLRTNLGGDPTFRELLGRVREVALGAYAHQDLPFEKVVEAVRPERSLNHTPLFQVKVGMDNTPVELLKLPGLELEMFNTTNDTSRFDLTLTMTDTPEGLLCAFNYDRDLFDAGVSEISRQFEALLNHIVTTPDATVKGLREKLDEADKQQWTLKAKELDEAGLLTFKTGRRRAVTQPV